MRKPGNVGERGQDDSKESKIQSADGGPSIPTWNIVSGKVESIHQGLTRTGIHVRIGQHVIIRLRLPSDIGSLHDVRIGQRVTAKIAADAVLLGVPGTWPGKERWNRWTGRIVLVEPGPSVDVVTTKVHGESWTLKSLGPVLGLERRPSAWDTVTITVDPARVRLVRQTSDDGVEQFHRETFSTQALTGGRVWLKGCVQAIRQVPTGWLLLFEIGSAHVSALVSTEAWIPWNWKPGVDVDVHVGQWEAWVKPHGRDTDPIQCRLFYG
jgi:molybdopterin-binding protein